MRQSVIWVQPNSSYVNKHHLNPMCPYVDLDTANKKPADAYPELDVCSWCEKRYENWTGFHDEIDQNDCGRCNATIDGPYDYCEECQRVIDHRQATR